MIVGCSKVKLLPRINKIISLSLSVISRAGKERKNSQRQWLKASEPTQTQTLFRGSLNKNYNIIVDISTWLIAVALLV